MATKEIQPYNSKIHCRVEVQDFEREYHIHGSTHFPFATLEKYQERKLLFDAALSEILRIENEFKNILTIRRYYYINSQDENVGAYGTFHPFRWGKRKETTHTAIKLYIDNTLKFQKERGITDIKEICYKFKETVRHEFAHYLTWTTLGTLKHDETFYRFMEIIK